MGHKKGAHGRHAARHTPAPGKGAKGTHAKRARAAAFRSAVGDDEDDEDLQLATQLRVSAGGQVTACWDTLNTAWCS